MKTSNIKLNFNSRCDLNFVHQIILFLKHPDYKLLGYKISIFQALLQVLLSLEKNVPRSQIAFQYFTVEIVINMMDRIKAYYQSQYSLVSCLLLRCAMRAVLELYLLWQPLILQVWFLMQRLKFSDSCLVLSCQFKHSLTRVSRFQPKRVLSYPHSYLSSLTYFFSFYSLNFIYSIFIMSEWNKAGSMRQYWAERVQCVLEQIAGQRVWENIALFIGKLIIILKAGNYQYC